MPSAQPFWALSRREARAHAMLLACLSWAAAAVILFARPGPRDLTGVLKGADFVHFYALGRAYLTGQTSLLYNPEALHRFQTSLVPASSSDFFLTVYPPQTALLFAPFALLPYGVAALLWAVATAAIYAIAVRTAWQRARSAIPDTWLIVGAAAGFPPFWSLVLNGQSTAFPFLGFFVGWLMLERRRSYLAGLALGLLAVKPPFGLVLAVVVLVGGEWSLLAGAVTSLAVQSAGVAALMGPGVLRAYADTMLRLPQIAPLLEPKPFQLHSIRAVTNLLPAGWGTAAWILLSAPVIVQTIRVWRTRLPVSVRLAIVVIATVLVSPHLTIYDATVLALPLLWMAPWIEATPGAANFFWPAVYVLFVTYLFPTALLIKLQASVFVLAWLFLKVTAEAMKISRPA